MRTDTPLIIIQARTGSTRLPSKTIMPFYEGKGIFRIIIENLIRFFPKENLVLATTTNSSDDVLALTAEQIGIRVFRGNELDVLDRFIHTAKHFDAKTIVRICADNPFLLPDYVKILVDAFEKNPSDYLSFKLEDNTPVIRSHWGLFSEITTLETLERVAAATKEPFYHEHVTNFIYEHPDAFNVNLIDLPPVFKGRKDYRFTLDTPQDFDLLRDLYLNLFRTFHSPFFTPEQLFSYLDQHGSDVHLEMKKQIEKNAK